MSDIVERLRYADQAIDRGNYAEAKAAAWQGHLELTALRARVKELEGQLELADITVSRLNGGVELQDLMKANNALRARVKELEEALSWQPIETAPRDGSEFHAWLSYEGRGWWEPRCRFEPEDVLQIWTRVDYDQDGWESGYVATHWMPVPPPPKETRNDK